MIWNLLFKRAPSHKDLYLLYEQLTALIRAGVPFSASLRLLGNSSLPLRDFVANVLFQVQTGIRISHAMARHSNIFSEIDVGVVMSSEETGDLEGGFRRLALHHQRLAFIEETTRRILTYPLLIFVVAVVMVLAIFWHFIPAFAAIYKEINLELPPLTAILVNVTTWAVSLRGILSIGTALLALGVLAWNFLQGSGGQETVDRLLLTLPGISRPARAMAVANFLRTFTTLIRSGTPLTQILRVLTQATPNRFLRAHLEEVQIHLLAGGFELGDLVRHPVFPAMVRQVFATLEQTARYAEVLEGLAEMYEDEVRLSTERLVQIAVPALYGLIGLFVGMVVSALMLPIYTLISHLAS